MGNLFSVHFYLPGLVAARPDSNRLNSQAGVLSLNATLPFTELLFSTGLAKS